MRSTSGGEVRPDSGEDEIVDPRERIDYSAIVDREPLTLPDGARIVVWPVFNIENWDTAKPMPRAVLTPPGETLFVPDIPNWSWQEYGMRVGFWRIKAAFDRLGIKPTFSLNASVCDVYPRVAQAALEAGWEFLPHTYHQGPMHLLEDERRTIEETVERIGAFTGTRPRGWIGPGLTQTYETSDLLKEAGLDYVADFVWDDEPTLVRTRAGDLVNVPYSVELNDIAMMILQHHESAELYRRTMDQFDRLYEESAERAKFMGFGIHPYISGVPHRIRHLESMLAQMAARPGVVFWSGAEIADWYKLDPRLGRAAAWRSPTGSLRARPRRCRRGRSPPRPGARIPCRSSSRCPASPGRRPPGRRDRRAPSPNG